MGADLQADLAAEAAVLGAALIAPDRAPEVAASLQSGDFFDAGNRHVFEAIVSLVTASVPVDLITVGDEIARRGTFESVGGRTRLVELTSGLTGPAHLRHHLRIVSERAALRRVQGESRAIASEAASLAPEGGDVGRFLDGIPDRLVTASLRLSIGGPQFVEHEAVSLRERIAAGPIEGLDGDRTGHRDLDEIVCGIRKGDLVIIGARPSLGKTALLTGISLHAVKEPDSLPVLFFSVEMRKDDLVERMASSFSGVDHYLVRTRNLHGSNLDKVNDAIAAIRSMRLAIDETRTQTILSIRAAARKFKRQHGLRFVVVDYLQLVEHRGSENRLQEVSAVSRGLKTLARELEVPVIAAAQLNRSADTQERPMLSNLRESGTIESDADIVMLLHQVRESVGTGEPRSIEVIVAKNRNGPVGTAELLFQPNFVRFVDLANEPPPVLQGPRPLPSEPEQETAFDQEGRDYHE